MYQRCCSRQNIQGSLHSSLDPAKFRTKVSESTLKARLWVLCQLFRAHPHSFTGGSSDAQQQHGSKKTQNPKFLLLFSCSTSTGLVKSVTAENRETQGSALPPAAHPNKAEQQIPTCWSCCRAHTRCHRVIHCLLQVRLPPTPANSDWRQHPKVPSLQGSDSWSGCLQGHGLL